MKAKPPSKNTGLLWVGAAEAPRKAPDLRQHNTIKRPLLYNTHTLC